MTYADQLESWQWIEFRSDFLESKRKPAGELYCDECGCDTPDETLHVHHKFYRRGYLAWDYDFDDLRLLCKQCHQVIHETEQMCRFVIRLQPPHVCYEFQAFLDALLNLNNPRAVKTALARAKNAVINYGIT